VDLVTVVLFVIGLGLLVVGAESLVRGASRLALAAGISPLVVGLTVVAFGTSSPEMAVSVGAALDDKTDIAVGNVVGSNIFNVLLILGLCALVSPLVIAWKLIRSEVPVMIGVSMVLWLFVWNGELVRWEAALLFAGLVAYVTWAIVQSRRESAAAQQESAPGAEPPATPSPWYVNVGYIVAGLAMLVLGSRWLVNGAVEFARELGLSELVIGLTIVAAGTSLPEVATSVIATYRGEREIAVGNVVGSNIFNILGVLGLTGLVSGGGLPVGDMVRTVDVPVMLLAAALCLPVFFSGRSLMHRWEGGMFVALYGVYVAYLVWNASDGGAPGWYVDIARYGLVPLTGAVVLMVAWFDRHLPNPEFATD
jgi:cation:H+ antiporter